MKEELKALCAKIDRINVELGRRFEVLNRINHNLQTSSALMDRALASAKAHFSKPLGA